MNNIFNDHDNNGIFYDIKRPYNLRNQFFVGNIESSLDQKIKNHDDKKDVNAKRKSRLLNKHKR